MKTPQRVFALFLSFALLLLLTLTAAAAPQPSKPLLIEGAMSIETSTLTAALQDPTSRRIGAWTYTSGTLDGYPVIVCLTGQGAAQTSAATAIGIETFHPCAVISQGTAGANDPSLHNYDIVLGRQAFDSSAWHSDYAPEGAGADYRAFTLRGTYGPDTDISLPAGQIYYDADPILLAAAHAAQPAYTKGHITEGRINSSNCWNEQVDRILWFHHTYGAACEEMETNPAAQICQEYQVPFLGIRIISNTIFHQQPFTPDTGTACQEYVLAVARQYIRTLRGTDSAEP